MFVLLSIQNDPDRFASDLHTELLNTARFTDFSGSELEAIDAARAKVATSARPPPPPPPPLAPVPNGKVSNDVDAGIGPRPEQEHPTAASTPQMIGDNGEHSTKKDAETHADFNIERKCEQSESLSAEIRKRRRMRVMPPHNFACLVAYNIRCQIQAHLRAVQRLSTRKKGSSAKSKIQSLPIIAGGLSGGAPQDQQGQQQAQQLQLKPPLTTVRIYWTAALHRYYLCTPS